MLDTEIEVVAEDVEYEFVIGRDRDAFAVVTDGLQQRGLPELYLITEGEFTRRLVDPDQGGARSMLAGRGVIALAQDLVRQGDAGRVRPVRIGFDGRSARFALSEVHEPANGFISLLVRDAPQVCSVLVTEWAER